MDMNNIHVVWVLIYQKRPVVLFLEHVDIIFVRVVSYDDKRVVCLVVNQIPIIYV